MFVLRSQQQSENYRFDMPKVREMLGIDENWRPSKMDLWALYAEQFGKTHRETCADVHQFIWMRFHKETSKDLTYDEYQETLRELRSE